MTDPVGCIQRVMDASGGAVDAKGALEMLEFMRAEKERLMQAGRTGDMAEALRLLAKSKARQEQIAKAVQRRHAALTAMQRGILETRIRDMRAAGLSASKSLMALIEGTVRNIGSGRYSVAAQRLGMQGRYVGSMLSELEAADPSIIDELVPSLTDSVITVGRAIGVLDRNTPLRSRPFLDNIVREMHGMKGGVVQNVTADARAQKAAAIFYKYAELSRRDLNRFGATIGTLEGWAGPQLHDSDRMMRVSAADWVEHIYARLDLEKTFIPLGVAADAGNAPEMKRILGEIYKTLTTGRDQEITPAERGETTGPANLAKQLAKHRVLHFKTADDWLSYNESFGHGHIFNAMIAHQDRAAQVGSVMSIFGPNPRALLGSIAGKLEKDVRDGNYKTRRERRRARAEIERLKIDKTQIGAALDIAIGQTAVSTGWARFGQNLRAVSSLAKLGAAVFSSTTDVVTAASNLRYHGKPLAEAYAAQITEAIKGRGARGEERARTFLLGEGFDGLIDQMVTPYTAEDGMPGQMHKAMVSFFKWTGLTRWTDSQRAGNARVMAMDMGRVSGRAWDSLKPSYKRVLRQHGMDSRRWDLIRGTAYIAPNGKKYVTPDRIANIADHQLTELIREPLEELELGLSERELARAEQDAREDDWLTGRTDKYHDRLAHARDRLQERKDALDERGKAQLADLTERMAAIHDHVADIREIYVGSRPSGDAIRHEIAADAAGAAVDSMAQLAALWRAADPETAQLYKPDSGVIREAAEAVKALTGEHPPTKKTVGEKISLAFDSLNEARLMMGSIPGAGEFIDATFEALETAAVHLQPGPAPRVVGRQEGAAGVRVAALKKEVAQLGRDLERARGAMDDQFIETWTQRGEDLKAFADRIEKSQAARAERAKADTARHAEAVARLYDKARFDLELDYRRFISDEVNFGILETDPIVRRLISWGGKEAGTLGGEIARTVMQFKGFPLAFTYRVLGRAIYGFEGGVGQRIMSQGTHLATMLAGLWVAGYAGMTAKDALRGYTPRDPTKAATFWAAMAQGGGAGIFGDFLFGEYNRFGNGALETLAGPTAGMFADTVTLWQAMKAGEARGKTAFDAVMQNVPFVNVWFARPVLDTLILNDIREGLSPGFVERQKQYRREKYGQRPIFD